MPNDPKEQGIKKKKNQELRSGQENSFKLDTEFAEEPGFTFSEEQPMLYGQNKPQ